MILAELCKRHHHVPVIANDIDIDAVLRRLTTSRINWNPMVIIKLQGEPLNYY